MGHREEHSSRFLEWFMALPKGSIIQEDVKMEGTRGMPMPERCHESNDCRPERDTPWTWNLLVEEVERLRKIERDAINAERQWERDTDREIGLLRDRVQSLESRRQPWVWPVPYYPQPWEITCATATVQSK